MLLRPSHGDYHNAPRQAAVFVGGRSSAAPAWHLCATPDIDSLCDRAVGQMTGCSLANKEATVIGLQRSLHTPAILTIYDPSRVDSANSHRLRGIGYAQEWS